MCPPLLLFTETERRSFGTSIFLRKRSRDRIGIVTDVPSIRELFDEEYYADLPGGILKTFGGLFKNDLKMYVYPLQRGPKDQLHVVDFHHCDFISDVPAANSKRAEGNR